MRDHLLLQSRGWDLSSVLLATRAQQLSSALQVATLHSPVAKPATQDRKSSTQDQTLVWIVQLAQLMPIVTHRLLAKIVSRASM